MTLRIPATEPAAAHHMLQAVQAATAVEAARQMVAAAYGSLTVFRVAHGDPESWSSADFDGWLEQSDAALAKGGDQ